MPADVSVARDKGIPNPDKISLMGLLRTSQRTNDEWTVLNRSRRNKTKVGIRTTSGQFIVLK